MRLESIDPGSLPDGLYRDWCALLADVENSSIFLSPDWITAWWRHYGEGHESRLLVGRDERDGLIGVAPFYLRRVRRPLGVPVTVLAPMADHAVGTEYLGVLARAEHAPAFIAALAAALSGEWNVAELPGLRVDDEVAQSLPDALGGTSARLYREQSICTRVPLPDDYETYLHTLSAKFRSTIRYRSHKLSKHYQVRLVQTRSQDELDGHLSRMFSLHQVRWKARGCRGSFYDPRKRAFYRDMAAGFLRQGRLRFSHLEVDGEIKACQFGFIHHGVLHSLQEAFDFRFHPLGIGGIGVILRALSIQAAIKEGARAYDFLGGDEDYKRRWGTVPHYVDRAWVQGRGSAGFLAYGVTVASRRARHWLKRMEPSRLHKIRRAWLTRWHTRRLRNSGGYDDEP